MKQKTFLIIVSFLIVLGLWNYQQIQAVPSVCYPYQGCTGTSTIPTVGQILMGTNKGIYIPVATSSLGIISNTGATTTFNSIYNYGTLTSVGTSTLATTTITQAIVNAIYGYGGFLSGLATTTFGTITQGIWNGTAINLSTTTGTLPVNRGGTGLTSGYNNTNWDTAYGWGNHAVAGYTTSTTYGNATTTGSQYVGSGLQVNGNIYGVNYYGNANTMNGLATTTFASSTITGSGTTTVNYVIGGNLNVGGSLYGSATNLTNIPATTTFATSTFNGMITAQDMNILDTLYVGQGIATGSMNFNGFNGYNAGYFQAGYFQGTSTTNNYFLGKTGIGTSTPYATLDIKGISATDPFRISSSSGAVLFIIDQDGFIQLKNNASSSLAFKQATTNYLTFDTSTDDPKIVFGKNAEIGTMQVDPDSGAVRFADISVTASSTAGTANSLSIGIDGISVLTVYASSTGNGMIEQMRVGIGTTTPLAMLDIEGNASTTGGMMIVSAISTASTTIQIGSPRNGLNPGKQCWWNGLNFTIEYYGYNALVKTVATSSVCQ